jgi:benzoylformate decarboxylase
MGRRTGRDVLLEVLVSEGVTHVFGNPGTTELPLMDALVDHPELHYVLGLQEATVVGMADGYAQATGRPAFVNVHTMAGLGNAIGNLTNAKANQAPMVVTAGNADRRHLIADPLLSGDLVGLAAGTVKWGHEVRHPEELGTVLRRAFLDAMTPPAGPVFVALPQDLLDQLTDAPTPPRSTVSRAAVPAGAEALAQLLGDTDPDRLAIVAGQEAATPDAMDALVALAERLGARVFGAPMLSVLAFPPTHPLWAGALPPRADGIRAALTGFQRVFLAGDQTFIVYPYTPGSPLPPDAELLHLTADPGAPGRIHPTSLGLVGDLAATLRAVTDLLPQRPESASRLAAAEAERDAELERFEQTAVERASARPMHPMAAVHAVLRALPPDLIAVDEAITAGAYLRGLHHSSRPGSYLFCRGGGLGWGMPVACGVSLAHDREPVLCVVGDGSAMYSPQALWTASREELPVLFAVVCNRQYKILKNNLRQAKGRSAETGVYVGMDIGDPDIDYVGLARSMGVGATRAATPTEAAEAARTAWSSGRPHLLELTVAI